VEHVTLRTLIGISSPWTDSRSLNAMSDGGLESRRSWNTVKQVRMKTPTVNHCASKLAELAGDNAAAVLRGR
jgi:hypothetical protein